MTTPIPSDLFNLKCQFEAWRKTRSKRTKTPDHLLIAAANLLDRYSASMICRACRINPRTLQRHLPSKDSSHIGAPPAPEFVPLSLTIPHTGLSTLSQQPTENYRLILERPDGARLSIFLPALNVTMIPRFCFDFLHS